MNTNEMFLGLSLARDMLVAAMQREIDSGRLTEAKDCELAANAVAKAADELKRIADLEAQRDQLAKINAAAVAADAANSSPVVVVAVDIKSSSAAEDILNSLEELRKKFPENYVVGEIPGVPLKINGEDWVLEGHDALSDRYFLTKGTTESIKQAKRMRSMSRDWRTDSSTYNDFFVHLRANGTLSNVPSNNPIPVVMSLEDMSSAIRKMKA